MSQFSQYTPPSLSSWGLVAHHTLVAAPCSTVCEVARGVDDGRTVLIDCGDLSQDVDGGVAGQRRDDAAWVEGESADAVGLPALVDREREEVVRGLGLAVGAHRVVG